MSPAGASRCSIFVEGFLDAAKPKHDITRILPGLVPGMIAEAHGRLSLYVLFTLKGRIFARIHVIPANPRTKRQQEGRRRFREAVQSWRELDEAEKLLWNRRARKMPKSGYNLFIGE